MKIIIAPDSFKESLNAIDVASCISKGVEKVLPSAELVLLPVGDGGEGTMEALVSSTGGKIEDNYTMNPLGKYVKSSYGILGNKNVCVIDMASSSGLHLIEKEKRNVLEATTFGTGELIKKALDEGYRQFIIGIGGSATNDGGAGMLQALGLKFKDDTGNDINPGGVSLSNISNIDISEFDSRINESNFTIALDVTSPFIGTNGASYVYGAQKGASQSEIEILDKNLSYFANKIEEFNGKSIHFEAGAGAGGGIGGAFLAFFPCEFKSGIDVVLESIDFENNVKNSNLVLTGEGKVDDQTFLGKTPIGVAKAAHKCKVPTIIIAGAIEGNFEDFYSNGVISVNSIINKPMLLNEAIDRTRELLENSTEQIIRTYLY